MKLFYFFLLTIIFSSTIYSTEIAIFKLSYVIDKSLEFNKFINKLDTLKITMQNELREDEKKLIEKKKIIDESKIIFTETEYNQQIENYNHLANSFKNKFDEYNNHININVEKNRNIVINEIIIITKELSLKNNFDIIFNEDQYFLASDNIDVSNQIIELLNKKKLDLEITASP